jgi:hypothetical protein
MSYNHKKWYFSSRISDQGPCLGVFYTNYLTPWNKVHLEKLLVPQLVKKFPACYKSECSVPCSHQPTTCPCPTSVRSIFILLYHLPLSSQWSLQVSLPNSVFISLLPIRTLYWNKYITYLLTPWSRVFLDKLTGYQLVKKFSAFYGTRRFITALK